jgi:hypothetical protein
LQQAPVTKIIFIADSYSTHLKVVTLILGRYFLYASNNQENTCIMNTVNPVYMTNKIQQFKHENETWKRLLEFIQVENVFLKTRLAKIMKEDTGNQLLEQAEYFQNQFISEDEVIALLRKEVADQEDLLTREVFEDGAIIKSVIRGQKKLQKEIEIVEQKFNKLKFEFNNYLSENL